MGFLSLEFWQDFTVQTVGAFIGFGTAILIYWLTEQKQVKNKLAEEKRLRNEKLAFFYFVVRKIRGIGLKHVDSFKEFGEKVKKDPVAMHLMRSTSIYELKKFTTENWEPHFASYVSNIFKKDRVQSIFQIISITEFICFLIEDSLRIHKEKLVELQRMKTDLKKRFQEIVITLNSPHISKDLAFPIYEVAQKSLQQYVSKKSKSVDDVQTGYNTFILPLFKAFMTGNNGSVMFKDNLDNQDIKSKVIACNSIYEDVLSFAEDTSGTFIQLSDSLKSGCQKLNSNLKDLETYLSENGFSDFTRPEVNTSKTD